MRSLFVKYFKIFLIFDNIIDVHIDPFNITVGLPFYINIAQCRSLFKYKWLIFIILFTLKKNRDILAIYDKMKINSTNIDLHQLII